jgi:hypothetical protein
MSAREYAFHPVGNTVLLASATSAPAGVQAPKSDDQGTRSESDCYQFYNAGAEASHIGYGKDASEATANAVIPTGTGANATKSFPVTRWRCGCDALRPQHILQWHQRDHWWLCVHHPR